jgi:hypothetical protein
MDRIGTRRGLTLTVLVFDRLHKRGWSVGAARKALIIFGGIGMTMLIPTIFTTSLFLIASLYCACDFLLCEFYNHGECAPL